MTGLLHRFSDWYLSVIGQGGYWLIAGLMALESTFVPIPSEVIIPPAAYVAQSEGQMSVLGIILAGTAGSWIGAAAMYWASRLLGRPLVLRFGRYVLLPPAKIELAETWAARYESAGVFFSRLLPVILSRHSGRYSAHGFSLVCAGHGGRIAALVLDAGGWEKPSANTRNCWPARSTDSSRWFWPWRPLLAGLYYFFVQEAGRQTLGLSAADRRCAHRELGKDGRRRQVDLLHGVRT